MIPATFAPMILKLIMPKLMDQFMKVFKLDKVLEYVEKPNELDVQMATINSKIKAMEDMLIELDKDSHPKKPFDERITALEKKLAK